MPAQKTNQRVGLLLPSSNTTQEPEFIKTLPSSVTLHCTRLTLRTIDPDSTIKIVAELETESRKLADADADVLVLSATAPSTRFGKGYDQELCERIQKSSGRRATTAATAMLKAFTALNIKKIVLAAPWGSITNQTVTDFIEAAGVKVLNQAALEVTDNNQVGLLDSKTAYDLALEADRPEADAIFLACGNWQTIDIVDQLERKTGKPVLTTNNCALWDVLRILGGHSQVKGYGSLLEKHLAISLRANKKPTTG